jgi:hypothetical protein
MMTATGEVQVMDADGSGRPTDQEPGFRLRALLVPH